MISKGTTHNNGAKLAAYMSFSKDGERAVVWQLRGFEATHIKDAFRDVEIMAGATKCEQPFFHVQVRNREGEQLTRAQWEFAADRIERMLGLVDQPRAITFHTYEHNDDEHMHVAWSRIDEETLTAKPLPFFKDRLKKISRELELELGLAPVQNEREGNIKFAPTRAEHEQARRLGLDIHEVRNTIRNCFDRSDCGASFQTALEQEGLALAQGDRRGFVVIDQEGGLHALGKRILDVSAAKLRDRLSDISQQLPSVDDARALHNEQLLEQIEQHFPASAVEELIAQYFGEEGINNNRTPETCEQLAPIWDRDIDDREWQDAVIHAAIEKEKIERQFVESRAQKQGRGGQQEKEHSSQVERPLDPTAAAIRLAYGLSQSPEEFARNLDQAGLKLGRVTKDEAERSHRNAIFAAAVGRFAPRYAEGDYVAINPHGHAYPIKQRATGESREDVNAFMRTLDGTKVLGLEATEEQIAAYKRPATARELWQNGGMTPWQSFGYAGKEVEHREGSPEYMRGSRADIWTAFKRSDDARAFVSALEDRSFTVAVVTREDVANSNIDRHHGTTLASLLPAKLREGDFVAIADDARVYNLNQRTTGESGERVQKFMKSLDRTQFQGVYTAITSVQERAALHEIERQAFRGLSAGELKRERDPRPTGRPGWEWEPNAKRLPRSPAAIGKTAARTLGKTLDVLSDAFGSLLAPTLTPEQIRDGERAESRRKAEGERTIDFARFTAELSHQRQQQGNERDAERQRREHEGGGRER